MALRCLLRRIPARSPSAPLMGPVHGASPATAAGAPRFLASQSERERLLKAVLEEEEKVARNFASIRATNDAVEKAYPQREMDMKEIKEIFRRRHERLANDVRTVTILGCASAAAMLASVPLMYYWP